MNTEARRKASAEFHAKRTAAGWKKVTVWLPPEALAQLAKLKAAHGSNDAAVQALLAKRSPVTFTGRTLTAEEGSAETPFGPVAVKPGSRLKKR